MLGAVRFIPRDELPAAAAPVDGSDGKRKSEKSSKKRKHGSKEDRKGKSKYRDEKRKHGVKSKHKYRDDDEEEEKEKEYSSDETSDDSEGLASRKVNRGLQESKRKEAGLEWMNLAPERPPAPVQDDALRLEPEKPVSNVKELNPFWKNDGIGLPTEEDKGGLRAGGRGRLPPPPGVGDGGASWRMKALKRAQEQASREGRKLDEVVEERWGSLASLTNSVAVQRAAHANAHMHAKRDRTRKPDDRVTDAPQAVEGRKGGEANVPEDEDDRRIRTGSRDYLKEVKAKDNRMREPQVDRKLSWRNKGSIRPEDAAVLRAAAQTYNKFSDDGNFLKGFGSSKPPEEPNTSNRVSTVMEYDELGPHAEKKKKKPPHGANQRPTVQNYNRIQTQTDRCQLCFDNVNRPKHLTMAIANFTYFTLPPRRPLVNGHCYIVPMQHEGATRNVDDDTWEELRNFKKCLVRMFDEQNKEAIFLETAMHLSRQKRHCVVECIPIPSSFAKDAPLYFKKAIDEAESEWSQHNAKRLIDTRIKGLRSSVPKNFPYFHVEFGMNGGYAHVIDDESKFKPEFGRAVLEGMLEIEEEDFHMQTLSRRDQEKFAKDFAKMWEPHDWTKMLE